MLALQVCTIVYSLYTLTAARGATRYMMVGYEKKLCAFFSKFWTFFESLIQSGNGKMMGYLLCSSEEAQIEMLYFYNFALILMLNGL